MLQERTLPLCLYSSRAALLQTGTVGSLQQLGLVHCLPLLTSCLLKLCGTLLPWCPVWPVAICTATGGDSRRSGSGVSLQLPFSWATTKAAGPALLPRLSPFSCGPAYLIPHSHGIWADGSAAQRELRKSSFSPNWWLPAFPSYIPPLNIPFFLPCLCRTEFYQPRAGSALLSSAGSWSQSAPFLLDFAELSKVWSPWAVGIISKG